MASLSATLNVAKKMLAPTKGNATVPDNCQLIELTDTTVLINIRRRYMANDIYTFTGNILLAVNPYEQLSIYGTEAMGGFPNKAISKNAPHVFASAEEAYQRIRKDRRSQSIVVSGESGAGKTETNKYMMRYLAWRSRAGRDKGDDLAEAILQSNPILEAFGNAKTGRNNNSSRFGKFVKVSFDGKGVVAGAVMVTYLLEKSRVVFQGPSERAYHAAYMLQARARARDPNRSTRAVACVLPSQSGPATPPLLGSAAGGRRAGGAGGARAALVVRRVRAAALVQVLRQPELGRRQGGVRGDAPRDEPHRARDGRAGGGDGHPCHMGSAHLSLLWQVEAMAILAAVLLLGNVGFKQDANDEYVEVADEALLGRCSSLLGCEDISALLLQRTMKARHCMRACRRSSLAAAAPCPRVLSVSAAAFRSSVASVFGRCPARCTTFS
jgi:hypothetical protein